MFQKVSWLQINASGFFSFTTTAAGDQRHNAEQRRGQHKKAEEGHKDDFHKDPIKTNELHAALDTPVATNESLDAEQRREQQKEAAVEHKEDPWEQPEAAEPTMDVKKEFEEMLEDALIMEANVRSTGNENRQARLCLSVE